MRQLDSLGIMSKSKLIKLSKGTKQGKNIIMPTFIIFSEYVTLKR